MVGFDSKDFQFFSFYIWYKTAGIKANETGYETVPVWQAHTHLIIFIPITIYPPIRIHYCKCTYPIQFDPTKISQNILFFFFVIIVVVVPYPIQFKKSKSTWILLILFVFGLNLNWDFVGIRYTNKIKIKRKTKKSLKLCCVLNKRNGHGIFWQYIRHRPTYVASFPFFYRIHFELKEWKGPFSRRTVANLLIAQQQQGFTTRGI